MYEKSEKILIILICFSRFVEIRQEIKVFEIPKQLLTVKIIMEIIVFIKNKQNIIPRYDNISGFNY